jgi:hypothetical protein
MRKLHFTDPELKNFALRGMNAVVGGMELLHVHIRTTSARFGSYAERVDSLTKTYELPESVLYHLTTGGHSDDNNLKPVFFYRRKYDGKIVHRHLADSGVMPYTGSNGSWLNDSNFLLDLVALKNLGIEVDY